MMGFLLVVATLAGPILALVIAEWIRSRRRRKNAQPTAASKPMPGWVNKTIREFQEGRK